MTRTALGVSSTGSTENCSRGRKLVLSIQSMALKCRFRFPIQLAGRRCQAHDLSRIFRKNVWMYQEKGWLSED